MLYERSFENLGHVRSATTHFPTALLFVSVGMKYFAGKRLGLRSGAWLLLVLETLGIIVVKVTGLVAHRGQGHHPVGYGSQE